MTPDEANDAAARLEHLISTGEPFTAADFPPHIRGDGKRFHVRQFNGPDYQVYGL